MTKQILVDATLPLNSDGYTYVTIQNDEKRLIKTIKLDSTHYEKQADEIVEIASKYNIAKIKVDVHGVGLGVYEYITANYHTGNTDRHTGDILLNSFVKIKKIDVEESFEKIEKYINDAIKESELIQQNSKQGSLNYARALKTQVELERMKLKLVENFASLVEKVVIECGEYE